MSSDEIDILLESSSLSSIKEISEKSEYHGCGVIILGILYTIVLFGLIVFLIAFYPNFVAYDFTIEQDLFLTMKDGVKLSMTLVMPKERYEGEKFPVLLETVPYRKDDSFYIRDYPNLYYFGKKGFAVARVDIRGTGSSEGELIPKEYSDAELDDCEEIILQLSNMEWSNGNVGMFGKSWSAFNSIMLAMRNPPGLKAVLSLHGSDDLYHDDVHFMSGVTHFDDYILSVDHENALPSSFNYTYPINEEYFKNRLQRRPWSFMYLDHQQNSDFWTNNSLRYHFDKIKIPMFFIGGMLDLYRDTPPRVYEHLKDTVPIKVRMGPWRHSFPSESGIPGSPGPVYEWKKEVSEWFNYYLRNVSTSLIEEPDFALFVRESYPPGNELSDVPGYWKYEDWPIKRTEQKKFYPSKDNTLVEKVSGESSFNSLKLDPRIGFEAKLWWGDLRPDQQPLDENTLFYDSEKFTEATEVIGNIKVNLKTRVDAKLANWFVRVTDVAPNGQSTMITGGALNGAQRDSQFNVSYLNENETYLFSFDLYWTTWKFLPDHKMRISVSNALFKMNWNSPYALTMDMFIDDEETWFDVPIVPFKKQKTPHFVKDKVVHVYREDACYYDEGGFPYFNEQFMTDEQNTIDWKAKDIWNVKGIEITADLELAFTAVKDSPQSTSVIATGRQLYLFKNQLDVGKDGMCKGESTKYDPENPPTYRVIELQTIINITSDSNYFYCEVSRLLYENQSIVGQFQHNETIKRNFQ